MSHRDTHSAIPQTLFDIAGIQARIHTLPGRPAFLMQADAAEVYQTQPRRVGEAVARNPKRFPEDFAFRLTDAELGALWSQNATANPVSPMARSLPLAFSHAGAYALSGVLTSDVAIEVGIAIYRAFAAMEAAALDEARFMVHRLTTEQIMKAPLRMRVRMGVEQRLTFDAICRQCSAPKWKVAEKARECLAMGLIDQLPEGMPVIQGDLFGGR